MAKAKSGISIENLRGVTATIRKLREEKPLQLGRNLKKAGLFLQRESQKIVPVDTGALKNSASTRAHGVGKDTVVTVGYAQIYAIFVHEVQATHKAGKTWKFLEIPMREKRKEIMKIIAGKRGITG